MVIKLHEDGPRVESWDVERGIDFQALEGASKSIFLRMKLLSVDLLDFKLQTP